MPAQESVSRSEFTFTSTGGTTLVAKVWEPAAAPRAILQIAHGMAEYIDRYDDFAAFLAGQGILVCGYDHYAHGKSVTDQAQWGVFPAKGGTDILIEDYHVMRGEIQAKYGADLPFIVFGHSMGSFIARAYIARHPEGVAAAIVCGTGHNPALVSKLGLALAKPITACKGINYRSKFLNGLADGAYAKAYPDGRTPFDWLNTDPAKVDEYIADPACGFMFSCSGYVALFGLTAEVADTKRIAAIPKNLPVFFIAGAQDPVGANGAGVTTVFEMFKAAGMTDVDCKIYDGMRHEILNEPGHAEVYADVLNWLNARLAGEAAAAAAAPAAPAAAVAAAEGAEA